MGNREIEFNSSSSYDIPSFKPEEEYCYSILNNPENIFKDKEKLIDFDKDPIYFNTNKNCTTEPAIKENNKNENLNLTEVIPCGGGKCLKKQEKEKEKI